MTSGGATNNDATMTTKKKILIFGGTGDCGTALVERALARRKKNILDVSIYVRNASKAKELFQGHQKNQAAKLTIIEGSLTDQQKIINATKDMDGVFSAVSSFHSPHTAMSDLTKNIVEASKLNPSKPFRYLHYGVVGLQDPAKDIYMRQAMLSIFSPWKIYPALLDHRRVLEHLQKSSLTYTIFQTPIMDKTKPMSPTKTSYQVGPPDQVNMVLWKKVGCLDAAEACLDAVLGEDEETPPKFLCFKYI